MPIYEARCVECGRKYEWLTWSICEDTDPCPLCGGQGERIFSLSKVRVFTPFTTRNITRDGSPVTVRSEAEHVRLCHENGVVPVDDDYVFPDPPSNEERIGKLIKSGKLDLPYQIRD